MGRAYRIEIIGVFHIHSDASLRDDDKKVYVKITEFTILSFYTALKYDKYARLVKQSFFLKKSMPGRVRGVL